MTGRKGWALLVVTIGAASAIAVPASAGRGVSTKVTIRYDGVHAPHGRVYSRAGVCRKHRKVWLVTVEANGEAHKLDFTFTNRRGKWVLSTQLQGAPFLRAKAPRKRAHGRNCAPDRSRTIATGLPASG